MLEIQQVARLCHEANKVYCQLIGDNTQVAWEDAPDWQRDAAIKGVQDHLDNPGADASLSHIMWVKQKIRDGWTYGEVKSAELKQHPCLVPFDKLPIEQQIKDQLISGIVNAMRPLL